MTTVFVGSDGLSGDTVTLDGSAFHHFVRVRRSRSGEELRVSDGQGRVRAGVIDEIGKTRARVLLGAELPTNEPCVALHLIVAAPKKPRAEWMIEKTTELGVRSIRFLRCRRGPRSFGQGALDRFQKVARAAAEQSDRAVLPTVSGFVDWKDLGSVVEGTTTVAFDPAGASLSTLALAGEVTFLIGPEGGWTERELLDLGGYGTALAALGARPLRIETAAVVAVAACAIPH